jgi:transcriptional regulator with GAF, ATPase, and Fis domain
VLTATAEAPHAEALRRGLVEALGSVLPRGHVIWLRQHRERWEAIGLPPQDTPLPVTLAVTASEAAAADNSGTASQAAVQRAGGWLALPLPSPTQAVEAVLIHPESLLRDEDAQELRAALAAAVLIVLGRCQQARRLEQLQVLLELAASWQRKHNLSELLHEMAHAAARALLGERASVFLHDRDARELVAHPALGVEASELRIRDDAGVAGRVLRTGQSERWDAQEDPLAVDHRVGERLGYATRSLVAAPLVEAQGKPVGVIEVLNHRDGRFSEQDEQFLMELARLASAALENTRRIDELVRTRDQLVRSAGAQLQLVGCSPQIQALRDTIERVAPTDLAVLLLGENGTGKEVVSRSLHLQSRRASQPFIAVNCAAIAESLLESELFGHEKGAFTDAVSTRPGKFEQAAGGTLLLDEIGELSLGGQAKLLRVLEEKVVVRVGGSTPIRTDVRVLAATNRNLVELVRERRFREDLYFRLNVVTLNLPPLRERGEDILLLANHFLQGFARHIGRQPPELSKRARERLLAHPWPGNVRELRNLMERVSYLCPGAQVEESDLAFVLSPVVSGGPACIPGTLSLTDATQMFQIEYIQRHIDAAGGNLAQAAERMGLHRSNLYRKMRQLGMQTDEE